MQVQLERDAVGLGETDTTAETPPEALPQHDKK